MAEVKSADIPVSKIIFILVSFLLALLDMTFLSEAFTVINPEFFTEGTARLVALFIATMANFMALIWGIGNGKRMEKKTVNPRSAAEFLFWLIIGLGYVAIRIARIVIEYDRGEGVNTLGEVIMMSVLAVSYISTGILIHSSARELAWSDAVQLRRTKKKFEESREALAADAADINESIGILCRYKTHFNSLEIQRKKIENSIQKTEKATMSDLTTKVLTKNKNISPVAAREVMAKVIASYRNEDK